MKKTLLALCATASFATFANEEEIYSVEGYCLYSVVQSSSTDKQYLKAYAKKLGFKPSREQCQAVRTAAKEGFKAWDKEWDFHQNRPYPGSAIRLSDRQIMIMRRARAEGKEIF